MRYWEVRLVAALVLLLSLAVVAKSCLGATAYNDLATRIEKSCWSSLYKGVTVQEISNYLEYTLDEMRKYHIERYYLQFVANTVQESGFNRLCLTGRSKGLCQINPRWQELFEKRKRAVTGKATDGNLFNPYTSIGLGVACFSMCLEYGKGDPWEAISRYNGSGPDSRKHREAVRKIHKKIAGE